MMNATEMIGNNVDIDAEMAKRTNNELYYDTAHNV
jgi:flagellar basal body rod protein FlgB